MVDSPVIEYTFPQEGNYQIVLRIIDKSGATSMRTENIKVKNITKKAA